MKGYLCLVGLLCAFALVTGQPSEEIKKLFQECVKEVGLPEPSEGPPKGLPNDDDPKIKCLHACFLKKRGGMVDGKIVAEKIIENIGKHMPGGATDSVKADVNECATKANAEKEECVVAGSFHKCMKDKRPKKQ